MTTTPTQIVTEFWGLMGASDFRGVGRLLSDDFRLTWPQSGEVIRGRDNFAQMNEEYPAHGAWRVTLQRVFGTETEAISEATVTDGVQFNLAITFFTIKNGLIADMVEYWPDPFVAPAHRSHLVEKTLNFLGK